MQSPLKILFIDDHTGLLEGVSSVLKAKEPLLEFYLASDTQSALSLLSMNSEIKLAIVDLNLDGEDGFKVISLLKAIRKDLKIIVYSMYTDLFHIKSALKEEVQGYVSKKSRTEELLHAILSVSDGSNFFGRETVPVIEKLVSQKVPREDIETQMLFLNYKSLSQSEKEVFELLAQKKGIEEIAKFIQKSAKTILNKRTIICQKLALRDRLDIVEAAKTLGVIG